MRVISMLDDYRKMCNSAETQGKYEAYKIYAAKYPTLFKAVEKYLYNSSLENLKDYITVFLNRLTLNIFFPNLH